MRPQHSNKCQGYEDHNGLGVLRIQKENGIDFISNLLKYLTSRVLFYWQLASRVNYANIPPVLYQLHSFIPLSIWTTSSSDIIRDGVDAV
jgi:hypothetical protein